LQDRPGGKGGRPRQREEEETPPAQGQRRQSQPDHRAEREEGDCRDERRAEADVERGAAKVGVDRGGRAKDDRQQDQVDRQQRHQEPERGAEQEAALEAVDDELLSPGAGQLLEDRAEAEPFRPGQVVGLADRAGMGDGGGEGLGDVLDRDRLEEALPAADQREGMELEPGERRAEESGQATDEAVAGAEDD